MMLVAGEQGPPRFAVAGPVVAAALAEMRFPERISISEAARRHRVLDNPGAYSGPWSESPHDLRFAERAMDALASESSYREVAVMGPSQTAKSEVGNNWQLHTVLYDPADMMFVMPDRTAIDEYVKTQWNKMLELTRPYASAAGTIPDLKARQLDGPSADNINLKQFRVCSLFFRWPTGPTFRAKPIARGRLDDYDDIPQDIGDQGDPLSLMLGRSGSFSAYGGVKVYVNSTPKLGRKRGIEAIVAGGTDERWYVDCLACGEPFALDTEERLHFDRTGTPAQAAASAMVVCTDPECGGFHVQSDKAALMATGRWVGRGETAVSRRVHPEGKSGELVDTHRLSQRWDGLMGMRRWADIAMDWRTAELAFENEQDEAPLKTFYQTVIGKNYTARGTGAEGPTESELVKRAKTARHRFGTVPREARCVVMAVDQAINRFEVAAWAFGPGYRAWLVDRFSIVNCGDEPLRPFTRPEHFAVLHPRVLARRYPVAGHPDLLVKPLGTVLDTGGMDGATDNAFAWWHSMVKGDLGSGRPPVPATAITLFKGGNNPRGRLLPPPTVDAKRQIKGAPQCELFMPNVTRLKDMADVGLRRDDGGAGSIVFPGDVDRHGELVAAQYIAEMKAETKEGEVWVRPPNTPNETLDLYVMARTLLLRLGGVDHSFDWVPAWARPPRETASPIADAEDAEMAAMRAARGDPEPEPAPTPMVRGGGRASPGTRPRVRVVRAS
jgi:phage terminase large subunit GpA-like protein